ncbi:hypothetical protein ScPMuIL_018762 [Solemya velum]
MTRLESPRITGSYPVWASLAQRSIRNYRELEQQSGVTFFEEVGGLNAGTKNHNFLQNMDKIMRDQNQSANVSRMTNDELRYKFPYFNFHPDDEGLHEVRDSGYINPRKLVQAEQTLASNNGCDVMRDIVNSVTRTGTGLLKVVTDTGSVYMAKKVLLTTGVSILSRDLLFGAIPDFGCTPETVALGQVSDSDAAKLKTMPVVVYKGTGNDWAPCYPRDKDGNVGFYFLPPVKYPDGKYYIKIGHTGYPGKQTLEPEAVADWYRNHGDAELGDKLYRLMQSLCKNVNFLGYCRAGCVTMQTPTHHPYIDMVTSSLGVAIGGNGWAAKSCDEIGRIAADMIITSSWNYDIPRDTFRIRYKKKKREASHSKL